jgi:hypothetical protein
MHFIASASEKARIKLGVCKIKPARFPLAKFPVWFHAKIHCPS